MVADTKFADLKTLSIEGQTAGRKLADDRTSQARAMFEHATAQTTQATAGLVKAGEEFAAFGRANLTAMTDAAQAYSAGMQELGRHAMASFQGCADHATTTVKAMATVKSLKEAVDLQAAFARAALDRALAGQAKTQEIVMQTAAAALAPIGGRVSATMERVPQPLAA